MPELPEMETYRKLLEERLVGQMITGVEINREKSLNMSSTEFVRQVKNRRVAAIERRAKHIIFKLEQGGNLLLHLMLGGWMYWGTEEDQPKRTKQVILSFGEKKLFFIGLRLGYLHYHTDDSLISELEDLGPEVYRTSVTVGEWINLIEDKRGRLKTTLVDQQFIAGIGNCYSDEICFAARLMPTKQANTLNQTMKVDLFESIQSTLDRAISYGGYMDQLFYQGDKLTGGYNEHCYVYDREGEPCPNCGGAIEFKEVSSRKCFYCPTCQRA